MPLLPYFSHSFSLSAIITFKVYAKEKEHVQNCWPMACYNCRKTCASIKEVAFNLLFPCTFHEFGQVDRRHRCRLSPNYFEISSFWNVEWIFGLVFIGIRTSVISIYCYFYVLSYISNNCFKKWRKKNESIPLKNTWRNRDRERAGEREIQRRNHHLLCNFNLSTL